MIQIIGLTTYFKNEENPVVMRRIRKKGKHFDAGGKTSNIEELIEMEGIFPLKDLAERLPIPYRRLERMIADGGDFSRCFCSIYTDVNDRGLIHVDLKRLNELLSCQAKTLLPKENK